MQPSQPQREFLAPTSVQLLGTDLIQSQKSDFVPTCFTLFLILSDILNKKVKIIIMLKGSSER